MARLAGLEKSRSMAMLVGRVEFEPQFTVGAAVPSAGGGAAVSVASWIAGAVANSDAQDYRR